MVFEFVMNRLHIHIVLGISFVFEDRTSYADDGQFFGMDLEKEAASDNDGNIIVGDENKINDYDDDDKYYEKEDKSKLNGKGTPQVCIIILLFSWALISKTAIE